ncbi:MAG: hypothetical protein ILO34_05170, partial [Kiritimatiellae bacterium]|nr:hypothetical protein [Kiritimatiellia bacterium]
DPDDLQLVHKFRPVLKNGVAGLYDSVADAFCAPVAGGAALSYGAVSPYDGPVDGASGAVVSGAVDSPSQPAPASAYDNGALYAQWDAIENIGPGQNSTSAEKWADLKSGFNLSVYAGGGSSAVEWTDDAYVGRRSNGIKFMYLDDERLWPGLGDTWTIQAFITPSSGWFQNYSGVGGFHADNVSRRGICFAQYVDNTIYFSSHKSSDNSYTIQVPASTFAADTPVLITMTGSPEGMKVYADKQLVGSCSNPVESLCTAPSFYIGNSYGNLDAARMYDGEVHAVRLYSKNLTENEIAFSYALDRARFCGDSLEIGVSGAAIYGSMAVATLERDSGAAGDAAQVFAYCGASDGGMSPAAWDCQLPVFGSFASGSVSASVRVYDLPPSAEYLRFAVGGIWTAAIEIDSLPPLDNPDPAPEIGSVELVSTSPSNAVYTVGIASFGDGSSSCDVYSTISYGGVETTNFVGTATGPTVTARFDGLVHGGVYAVRFYAVNQAVATPAFYNGGEPIVLATARGGIVIGNYELLDYIQSSGTQYINTGYMPTTDLEVDLDITAHAGANEQAIFGSGWSTTGYFLMYYMNNIRYHTGGAWTDFPNGGFWSAGERTHVHLSHYGIEINGNSTAYSPSSGDDQRNLCIFMTGDGSGTRGTFRLHHLAMTNSTAKLRDYYPARDTSSGAVGLYDLVSGTFFPDADGRSPFVASAGVLNGDIFFDGPGQAPQAIFPSVMSTSATNAVVAFYLNDLGAGAVSCDITVSLAGGQGAATRTVEIPGHASLGMVYLAFDSLRPACGYTASVTVDNGLAGGTASFVIPFSTKGESYTVGVNSRPGFIEATDNNAWNYGFDITGGIWWYVDAPWAAHMGNSGYSLAGPWTQHQLDGTTTTGAWRDYVTFGYKAKMWMETGVYYFGGNIDDNAGVVIDGAAVLNVGATGNVGNPDHVQKAAYTCTEEGWHDIAIYAGNGWGGYGPYGGFPGIAWARGTDDRTDIENWHVFTNSESFVRYAVFYDDTVVLANSALAGQTATCVVNSERAAGAAVYLYAADGYLGSDISLWGEPVASGTLDANGSYTFTVALPAGTQYVRFITGEVDGIVYESVAYPVAEIAAVDASKPAASFTSVVSTAPASATISAAVSSCGQAAEVDIVVSYGYSPDDLEFEETFTGFGMGSAIFTIEGLDPAHTYYATFHAESAGDSSDETGIFSFTTPRTKNVYDALPGDAGWSLPGLWQADEAGGLSTPVTNHPTRVRAIGPLAFNSYYTAAGTGTWKVFNLDGTSGDSGWYQGGARFGYAGYIYLDKTHTYYIHGWIDDAASISIDGTAIIYNGDVNYTPEFTGWHYLEALAIDYTGYAGSVNGFMIDGVNLADPGDGSILRTRPGVRDGRVVSSATVDGKLNASLEFGAWQVVSTSELWVAYGPDYGGDDWSDWDRAEKVADLPVETTAYNYEGISGAGTDYLYAHFFTKAEVDGTVYWQWCGDEIVLDDGSRPIVDFAVADGSMGDTLRAGGVVVSSGAGDTAALSFLVSTSSDMAGAVSHAAGDYASGEVFDFLINVPDTSAPGYIAPGGTYYVQAVLTGEGGAKNVSSVIEVYAEDGADFGAVSATDVNAFVTFAGTLADAGANTATVYLYTGAAANSLTNTASCTVAADGDPFSITVEFPAVRETVYWAFMVSNSCASATWTSWTETASIYIRDQYTYYWKSSVHAGDWADPANWTVDGNPAQATYPDGSSCVAVFDTSEPGTPYEISVDRYVGVLYTYFQTPDATYTFTGEGYGDDVNWSNNHGDANPPSGIFQAGGWPTMGTGISLTFKDLYICLHGFAASNGLTFTLDHSYLENWGASWANGVGVTLDIKNTSVWRQSAEHLHSTGSDFHLILDDSVFWGAGGGVINLAYDHNSSSGSYLIDIYGTHPYIECGNHLL